MEDEELSPRPPGTIADRETLMRPVQAKRSGFAPRSIQQLTKKKPPRSMLNVECSHLLRCSADETAHGHHPVMYTMWVEAGKHKPPYPDRPDSNYNSNVWRNFRKSYGFHTDTKGQKIGEMIAQLYPLNLPAPSKVGEYTYPRFLSETPLIKDQKMRKLAIERTTQDILEFKRIRLKSEMRNPPLDERGDIMPPVNFKRYATRFIPPSEQAAAEASNPTAETRTDIFGKQVPVLKSGRNEPFMWKLSYRLNNPEYEKVQDMKVKVKQQAKLHPPAVTGLSGQRSQVH